MIVAKNLTKTFDRYNALDDFSTEIGDGSIFGLVGSNGSGKSTLLRLISGIYSPNMGTISVSDNNPFENPKIKQEVFFVADEPFFFTGASMNDMADFYEKIYPNFDRETYNFLCYNLPIDPQKKIHTFSKGMKRQTSLITALSSKPKYLLLDEAFDGLDPVMRSIVRRLLSDAVADRQMTVVIASHNLRELEDLCDHMGLLHKGKVILEREIDEAKLGLSKIQVAFDKELPEAMFDEMIVISKKQQGRVCNFIARGNSKEIGEYIQKFDPLFVESVPLTLEEVFIYEMEAVGYDYNNILL